MFESNEYQGETDNIFFFYFIHVSFIDPIYK